MDRIENGIYGTHGSSRERHKSFLIHYGLWGGGGRDLKEKRILTCLYCNLCNKINMGHSDTENKLLLFLVLCSEFSTLIILILGFEGWQV